MNIDRRDGIIREPEPQLSNLSKYAGPEREAGRRLQQSLLNCYCREVAHLDDTAHVRPWDPSFEGTLAATPKGDAGPILEVLLPRTNARLAVRVAQASMTANYEHRSPVYEQHDGRPWTVAPWRTVAHLLLAELSIRYSAPHPEDLLAQMENSVEVAAEILRAARPTGEVPRGIPSYIESEQSLVFGHAFHPAPKSRVGFSESDVRAYSPEVGAHFPLHYFSVRKGLIVSRSLEDGKTEDLVEARAPVHLHDPEFALIPTHPWEARYLLSLPRVQEAIRDGHLRDRGAHGPAYYPTSSVRTLYRPNDPYFYKFSLHVRLTNCIRKNAIYELEGAVHVTKIMRGLRKELRALFPDFHVLDEPAYLTADLGGEGPERVDAMEGFALILRRGIDAVLRRDERAVLAASLFADGRLPRALEDGAGHAGFASTAEAWFASYVRNVLHPVFHCFFRHGLIFEPHLQNVVVALREGSGNSAVLRDFEGVKLVGERFGNHDFTDISERARTALTYDEARGWNRIAYCLFVNNFCEAIASLSQGNAKLETRLWAVVADELQNYQRLHGDEQSKRRIQEIVSGAPLPAKANLITRVTSSPDRAAPYVPLANPMYGGKRWS